MLIVDLLGWWYSRGWGWALNYTLVKKTGAIVNFFSIKELLKTLFAPFRQDSINTQGAPISVRFQAFGENIISRFFGLIIRGVLILVGTLLIAVNAVLGLVSVVLWPLLPISPVVAMVLLIVKAGV
jgi:hypothetical protein